MNETTETCLFYGVIYSLLGMTAYLLNALVELGACK